MLCVSDVRFFWRALVLAVTIFSLGGLSACGGVAPDANPSSLQAEPLSDSSGNADLVNASVLTAEEQKMLEKINALRASLGLGAVSFEVHAEDAARAHTEYMSLNKTLTHSEPAPQSAVWDRLANQGLSFNASGEIIACGNAGAEATFQQWFNSSGHYAIMVSSKYTMIGIARSISASGSCSWYWTADFAGT